MGPRTDVANRLDQVSNSAVLIVERALQEANRLRLEALLAAEQSCDALIAAAQQQCDEMIAAARQEATNIVEEARRDAERIRAESAIGTAQAESSPGRSSARVVLEMAMEESSRLLEIAAEEAQALRNHLITEAEASAVEILGEAEQRASETLADTRVRLEAAREQVRQVYEQLTSVAHQISIAERGTDVGPTEEPPIAGVEDEMPAVSSLVPFTFAPARANGKHLELQPIDQLDEPFHLLAVTTAQPPNGTHAGYLVALDPVGMHIDLGVHHDQSSEPSMVVEKTTLPADQQSVAEGSLDADDSVGALGCVQPDEAAETAEQTAVAAAEEALVAEDALVSEEALVAEDVLLSGEALAAEDVLSSGEALAAEDALVSEEALVAEDALGQPLAADDRIAEEGWEVTAESHPSEGAQSSTSIDSADYRSAEEPGLAELEIVVQPPSSTDEHTNGHIGSGDRFPMDETSGPQVHVEVRETRTADGEQVYERILALQERLRTRQTTHMGIRSLLQGTVPSTRNW